MRQSEAGEAPRTLASRSNAGTGAGALREGTPPTRAWNHSTARLSALARRGKTAALTPGQVRILLDSIDPGTIIGLRDRAIIGLMVYSFAQVSAAAGMTVEDYYLDRSQRWFRLREKGGRIRDVPAHPDAEACVDAYLDAAGIRGQHGGPLFRSVGGDRQLSARPMHRTDVLRMIKRRARLAGLPGSTCCHTFRTTGIVTYLDAV